MLRPGFLFKIMNEYFGQFVVCFLLALSHFCIRSSAQNTFFDFSTFSLRNLTLLGDAYLRNGAVGLTIDLGVPNSSSGRALYNKPVQFLDTKTKSPVSFTTRFSFSITNVDPVSFGDGLAFVIAPDDQTLGSPGGFLGIVNATKIDQKKTIAVEFDTFLDVQFNDPNANHVGLDLNNLSSFKAADLGNAQIDLKSGDLITAWIEYKSPEKMIYIWLSYTNFKPTEPVMSVSVDFSKHFSEFMYIGFSASTGGSTEVHIVEEWSFQSLGLPSRTNSTVPKTEAHPILGASVIRRRGGCRKGLCLGRNFFIGIAIGTALVIALTVGSAAWLLYRKWRGVKCSDSFKSDIVKTPRRFTYKELTVATKGFSTNRVAGHGAFGTVYKGILPDSGDVVAVKRSTHNTQGKSEFIAELSIIGRLRHRNLVQLQGWCYEKGELLLIYEYMPNGSLDKALFQEGEGGVLSWSHRYRIVMGVASALVYLHGEWEQQVVHRDIKASNIMLDASFNARLGDFGLARLTDHNKSPDATLTAGTMGYLAPEYLQSGKVSEKTDVFSFGVVVLEVACGRRPIEKDTPSGKSNLVDWVWGLHGEGKLLEAADVRLDKEFEEEEMRRMLLVGLLCCQPDSVARPTMRQVLQILNVEASLPRVPSFKPSMIFSSKLPLRLQDIVSDCGQSQRSSTSSTSFRMQASA